MNDHETTVGPPSQLDLLLDHSDLKRLIGLARITRSAFERLAVKDGSNKDLKGMCYDASCFLRRLATAHGIDTEMGEGENHFFVLYGDIVIDVTSTQFDQPMPVAVLPLVEAEKRGPWWKLWARNRPISTWSRPIDARLDEEIDTMMGFGVGEGEL